MPFCKNCGSQVDGQFCAKCGTPVAPPAAGSYTAPPPAGQGYVQPAAPDYAQPPAATAGGLTDNVAGLLCYVVGFITGILFLALAPYNQNKFIRFHAFQSIFYSAALIGLWIVLSILGAIFHAIVGFGFGLLWSLVMLLVWLGSLGVWILLMVKAYQGQKYMLPVIGPLADKQA